MSQSWNELSRKEQLECVFWDTYKDAHGFRPRHVGIGDMSEAELEAELEYLSKVIEQNAEFEREAEARAVVEFEKLVAETVAIGAADRETALRWIMDASICNGDWEFLCYEHGLPYHYFAKETV
jgi:hypothetical protein